jgi:hypothetical protein
VLRRAASTLALMTAVALGGCGTSRTVAPNLSVPAKPDGFRALGFPHDGVALIAPNDWPVLSERAPLVTLFSSGPAVVAVWRYARTAPPPTGTAALLQAQSALMGAARARDPGLRVIRSKAVTVDRASAIELDALEQVAGHARRVRSMHIYVSGAEIVLEEYAPVSLFHAVDHTVFSPVRRSLRLTAAAA